MSAYEKMWKEHKQWLENGLTYYNHLLNQFEDKNGAQFNKVEDSLATFQFHLDRIESMERNAQKAGVE